MSISTHVIKGGGGLKNHPPPSKKKGNKKTVWKDIPRIQTLTSFADPNSHADLVSFAEHGLGRSICRTPHAGRPMFSPCRHLI